MSTGSPSSDQHVPTLKMNDLTIVRSDGAEIVSGLSISVGKGELLAVVGESGSGKTIAARAVMGLLPEGIQQKSGTIELEGQNISALSPGALRRLRGSELGMVFQEPLTSLNPAIRVGPQLVEALLCHQKIDKNEASRRAVEMLERVRVPGAKSLLRSYPHEFSGGMRQRILLASVLLGSPKLIIADEPTTALDTLSQKEVLDLMAELGKELDVSIMLITHNLALAARYASKVAVMQTGRLVESGAIENVLRCPQHEYTRALIGAIPKLQPDESTIADMQVPVLSVKDLSVQFQKRVGPFASSEIHLALNSVSLDIARGEIVAVVGGSGSGKTTLGRAILGLTSPTSGKVFFDGRECALPRDRDFRSRTQMVFQDPFSSLDPRLRVRALVAESLRPLVDLTRQEKDDRVAMALADVGLSDFAERFPHQLSGGQRQRVAIARAIVADPDFIIADEPISALDMSIQAQVLDLFARLQRERGFACLFISHDLAAVGRIAGRLIVMEQGKIVEAGTAKNILEHPTHPYTRALVHAAPILSDELNKRL